MISLFSLTRATDTKLKRKKTSPVNLNLVLTKVTVRWLFVSLTALRIALLFSISVVIGFSVKTLIPLFKAGMMYRSCVASTVVTTKTSTCWSSSIWVKASKVYSAAGWFGRNR